MDKVIKMLTTLTPLLLGTQGAPKLILFLPVAEKTGKGKVTSWLKKDWLNHRVRLFFVDPLTYELAKARW